MWGALMASLWARVWLVYLCAVYFGDLWGRGIGLAVSADLSAGLGWWLFVIPPLLTVEPWRGLQRAYRCGWWPTYALVAVSTWGALLYAAGTWLVG